MLAQERERTKRPQGRRHVEYATLGVSSHRNCPATKAAYITPKHGAKQHMDEDGRLTSWALWRAKSWVTVPGGICHCSLLGSKESYARTCNRIEGLDRAYR